MSIKPILFNTDMVQAIMSGNKTETRRKQDINVINNKILPCKYNVGDILYVRETFKVLPGDIVIYRADGNTEQFKDFPWKPSLHMPKKYARIFLKVTKVYTQNLQDMTYTDLDAEGFNTGKRHLADKIVVEKKKFAETWNNTLKKQELNIYGFEANPCVWVIRFEQCKNPGKDLTECIETLDLLDRNKAKHVTIDKDAFPFPCPNCNTLLFLANNFCPNCGQRLDWKDLNNEHFRN